MAQEMIEFEYHLVSTGERGRRVRPAIGRRLKPTAILTATIAAAGVVAASMVVPASDACQDEAPVFMVTIDLPAGPTT